MTAAALRLADGELAARGVGDERGCDAAGVTLPDEYGCACVLLLLHEHPSSGHELHERLRPLGVADTHPEGLHRTLRQLEWVGHVWAADGVGHGSATTYHVTAAGAERLGLVAIELCATRTLLGRFLARVL